MTTRVFLRAGLGFSVHESGAAGLPVVFQHGLCGDAGQTAEVFPDGPHWRRITLECRGHGSSEAGDPAAFSIATFTTDIAAFIESLRVGPVVIGGISMGAAIALRLTVHRPDLVRACVLGRPAWVAESAPNNMSPNLEVGRLLQRLPADQARTTFAASETARRLAAEAPDNLASLDGFFSRTPQHITAALLSAIAMDGPGVTTAEIRAIALPTLIIGHDRDLVHPLSIAEALAHLVPGARLVAITAKAIDRARYVAEFRAALQSFLKDHL